MAFPKGQLEASFKHTLCMLLFFAPGEGVAECEVFSELLIIIFHLHSLWLSLSRSLLSGTFFFLFFFFCPQGTATSEHGCPGPHGMGHLSLAVAVGMETMLDGGNQ